MLLIKGQRNRRLAFTLIELLVVIAIIGLLAVIALISLNHARANARDAKRLADIRQMQTALSLYYDSTGHYPSNAEVASGKLSYFSPSMNTTTFMEVIPSAPTPADGPCSSAQAAYTYNAPADGSTYTIDFCISKGNGELSAGVLTAWPGGISGGSTGNSGGNGGNNEGTSSAYFNNFLTLGENAYSQSYFFKAMPLADGFLAVGRSDSGIVSKYNLNGQKDWETAVENSYTIYDAIKTEDGYIIAGSGSTPFLAKIDNNGQQQWRKDYNVGDYGDFYSLDRLSSGNYALAGYVGINSGDNWEDLLVMIVDSSGEEVSRRQIGIENGEEFYSVKATPDGGFIAYGFIYNDSTSGNNQAIAAKFDSGGNESWRTLIGDHVASDSVEGRAISIAPDGGYMLANCVSNIGNYTGLDSGYTLVKLDSSGNVSWHKALVEDDSGRECLTAMSVDGSGYVAAGMINGLLSIANASGSGTLSWSKDISKNNFENKWWSQIKSVEAVSGGGYMIAGSGYYQRYYPFNLSKSYARLTRTDAQANVACHKFCEMAGCADEDGCGGTCDNCQSGTTCFENNCCTPQCAGKQCGDNGCGGSCGTCQAGFDCLDTSCLKQWSLLGQSGFSGGTIYGIEIDVYNGTPYVSYEYDDSSLGGLNIAVWKFVGGSWQQVGTGGISPTRTTSWKHYLDVSSGVPYVAFSAYDSGTNDYRLGVKKYDGNSWVTVGEQFISSGNTSKPSMAFDGQIPYIVFSDSAVDHKTVVKKLVGNSWQTVGGSYIPQSSQYGSGSITRSIKIDNGMPYVAFPDYYNVSVKRFNGSSWEAVGQERFYDVSNYIDLEISGGVPYVAFDRGYTNEIVVMKLGSDSGGYGYGYNWETVGDFPGNGMSVSIEFKDGNPYVSFRDFSNQYYGLSLPFVYKYSNSSWSLVGHPNAYTDCKESPAFKISGNVLYRACQDANSNASVVTISE